MDVIPRYRVLLVEDDPAVPTQVADLLARASSTGMYELTHVSNLAAAVDHLDRDLADVVLLDLDLPDADGDPSAVEELVRRYPGRPVVVLSATEDATVALETVRRGAQDYLPREQLNAYMLARVIRFAVERSRWYARANVEAEHLREVNARLEEFAGLVAHDLKGPMTSISGLAATLLRVDGAPLDARQRDLLDKLGVGAERLATVVDGLLEATRESELSTRQRVDLREVASEVMSILGPAVSDADADVRVGELPEVWGIPALYRQVLLNLISNALVHHPGPHPPRVAVTAEVGDEVVITVADDGAGVPEDARDRVFVRGYTTGPTRAGHAGQGQGLSAARVAVARLGGRIWVDDAEIGGAAFRIAMPARTLAGR